MSVTFTLDGQTVTTDAGQTIWEVAHGRGLVIPHLCHKPAPGYRPDGNCRACMVEVAGERTLVASCIREVTEGMVVTTASPRVQRARAGVMELLRADQPAQPDSPDRNSHFGTWRATHPAATLPHPLHMPPTPATSPSR
jgi:formate dehydrogenase major subunit